MYDAVKIAPNGVLTAVSLPGDDHPDEQLKALYAALGAEMVETLPSQTKDLLIWADEELLLRDPAAAPNVFAAALTGGRVHGPVVVQYANEADLSPTALRSLLG